MKPTADEMKDKPDEVRHLVGEALGLPLSIHRPNWTTSHDACRTFEDAMSEEEFKRYIAELLSPYLGGPFGPNWKSLYPSEVVGLMKATPLQKCLAFLIVKGAAV